MKILIFGGTGAMGVHLVSLLSQRGDSVYVTTRSQRDSNGNVHFIEGDAHNIMFLNSILNQKWDVIVDFMVYSTKQFQDRVDLLLRSTHQYIFLSSARVYSNQDTIIKEDTPRLLDVSNDDVFLQTDEYSLSKARQENLLFRSKYNNWTVVRPYITYNKDRLQLGPLEKEEWLFRAMNGNTIIFSNEISSKISTMTYGLDVSKGIVEFIGCKKTLGEVFHVVSSKSQTWSEVLSIYLSVLEDHLGYAPKVKMVDLSQFFYCRPAKYQVIYDRLFNRQFDNSKLSGYIDVDEFLEVKEGLVNCLKDFLVSSNFGSINWIQMARMDKLAGESTSLRKIKGFRMKMIYIKHRYFK